jgi:hypothetical protein
MESLSDDNYSPDHLHWKIENRALEHTGKLYPQLKQEIFPRWAMKKKAMVLIGFLAILFVLMVIFIPVSNCSNTICQLGEVTPVLATQQQKIDNDSVHIGYTLDSNSSLYSGYVTSEGKIILVLKSGAILLAERNISDVWSCTIYPEKFTTHNLVKNCGKQFKKD